eukprot:5964209-Amphidinium_carterae.1
MDLAAAVTLLSHVCFTVVRSICLVCVRTKQRSMCPQGLVRPCKCGLNARAVFYPIRGRAHPHDNLSTLPFIISPCVCVFRAALVYTGSA